MDYSLLQGAAIIWNLYLTLNMTMKHLLHIAKVSYFLMKNES